MRRYLTSRKIPPRNWFLCYPVYPGCCSAFWKIPDSGMITSIFFLLVPFLKRAPYIIIHLAWNAERRADAYWCRSNFQNLNHSFICPVPVPYQDFVSGFWILDSGFRIPAFPYALHKVPLCHTRGVLGELGISKSHEKLKIEMGERPFSAAIVFCLLWLALAYICNVVILPEWNTLNIVLCSVAVALCVMNYVNEYLGKFPLSYR